jgi:hypothetical protein
MGTRKLYLFTVHSLGAQLIPIIFWNVQQVMTLGFDWDSKEMSVMFMAKLAKPLMGTARVVINSIHIKGDVCLLLSPLVMLFLTIISNLNVESFQLYLMT